MKSKRQRCHSSGRTVSYQDAGGMEAQLPLLNSMSDENFELFSINVKGSSGPSLQAHHMLVS